MSGKPIFIATLAAALGARSALPKATTAPLAVAPAPITFDGHVSGQATDNVFMLVPDANPATPGLTMKTGEV